MVTDAVLWALMVVAVAFFWLGCHNTRRRPKEGERPHHSLDADHAFADTKFNQAA